ncbi:MAG: methyltransferase domain-containing protein [Pirellulales bacterium]
MKTHLLNRLVCPLDKTPLELQVWSSEDRPLSAEDAARARSMGVDPASLATEILSGVLVNRQRKIAYPIHDGVPRMLTFRCQLAERFWMEHGDRVKKEFPGCELPDEEPRPGEADVLRTFSSEWVNFDWDGSAYWGQTPEGWFQSMRYMLDLEHHPVDNKVVLEVGIGVGGVADYMARKEGCELIGVDLGYAVDVAFKHFGGNPFLHVVQASAFAPPFRQESFDFVYSWGVLHHTYSTRDAFRVVSQLPKKCGRCYIWVYSPADEERTLIRRGVMALERVVRPVMWRLPERAQTVALAPLVPLYMLHQWWQVRRGNRDFVPYGFREAIHAARDRFTPRYVARHTDEEICGWFREAGYQQLSCAGDQPAPEHVPVAMTACTGVGGIRT